jgi:hypothetical protein
MTQLAIRLLCICISLALCEPELRIVHANGFSAVFKQSTSYEHSYQFVIPIGVSRTVTVEMHLKSLCPPNSGMFAAEFGTERLQSQNQIRLAKHSKSVVGKAQHQNSGKSN